MQLKHTADFHKLNIYPVLRLFKRELTLPLVSVLLCMNEQCTSCRPTSGSKVHLSKALQSASLPNVGKWIGQVQQEMTEQTELCCKNTSGSVIASTIKPLLRHYINISRMRIMPGKSPCMNTIRRLRCWWDNEIWHREVQVEKQIMSVKSFQILKHSTTACVTYIHDVKVITATTILMTFAG